MKTKAFVQRIKTKIIRPLGPSPASESAATRHLEAEGSLFRDNEDASFSGNEGGGFPTEGTTPAETNGRVTYGFAVVKSVVKWQSQWRCDGGGLGRCLPFSLYSRRPTRGVEREAQQTKKSDFATHAQSIAHEWCEAYCEAETPPSALAIERGHGGARGGKQVSVGLCGREMTSAPDSAWPFPASHRNSSDASGSVWGVF